MQIPQKALKPNDHQEKHKTKMQNHQQTKRKNNGIEKGTFKTWLKNQSEKFVEKKMKS